MKHYRQLTLEQRVRLRACLEAQFNFVETARILGVHKSTIGRELARNGGPADYHPHQAQRLLQQRRQHRAPRNAEADREQNSANPPSRTRYPLPAGEGQG